MPILTKSNTEKCKAQNENHLDTYYQDNHCHSH